MDEHAGTRLKRRASLGFIFLTVSIDVLGGSIITSVLPRLIELFEAGHAAQASNAYALLSFLFASFTAA